MVTILRPGEKRTADKVAVAHHTLEKPELNKSLNRPEDKRHKKYHPPRPGHPLPGPGTPPPSDKKKKHPKLSEKQRFLWAEGEQESGNNYLAENPNSGALGRWQVMPSNLPEWLPESGWRVLTPSQFLHNHKAQDAVAWHILGGYYDKYGPGGAAAMWYSGQPDPSKTYGDPPVYVYVADVLKLMDDPNATNISQSGSAVPMPWNIPRVEKNDSWSTQVKLSATRIGNASAATERYAIGIQKHYHK